MKTNNITSEKATIAKSVLTFVKSIFILSGLLYVGTTEVYAQDSNNDENFYDEIEKEVLVSAKVYPNPANEYTNLQIIGLDDQKTILTINDECGRPVFYRILNDSSSSKTFMIDTRELNSGVYTVVIQRDNDYYTKRLLVLHSINN